MERPKPMMPLFAVAAAGMKGRRKRIREGGEKVMMGGVVG